VQLPMSVLCVVLHQSVIKTANSTTALGAAGCVAVLECIHSPKNGAFLKSGAILICGVRQGLAWLPGCAGNSVT
jgi:hypothetical protein